MELVRFLGTPASTYARRVWVSPARARSKSLAARSSAAGGRSEGLCGVTFSVEVDWIGGVCTPFVVGAGAGAIAGSLFAIKVVDAYI